MSSDAYAGVRRRKQTPWRVKFGDALVSRVITIGGIATIGAVLLVVIVLLATAWPLYRSPAFSNWRTLKLTTSNLAPNSVTNGVNEKSIIAAGCDEFGSMTWTLDASGSIRVLSAGDGKEIAFFASPATDDRRISCFSQSIDRETVTVGFNDGSFQFATIKFQSTLLLPDQLPENIRLDSDHPVVMESGAVYEMFSDNAYRKIEPIAPQWSKPQTIADSAIEAIDYLPADTSNQFAQSASSTLIATSGELFIVARLESRENLMTGEVTHEVKTNKSPLQRRSQKAPLSVVLANRGSQAIVVWDTGTLDRFAVDGTGAKAMESVSGLPGGGKITCTATVIARQTLLIGDDGGKIHGWNVVQTTANGAAADGYQLIENHTVEIGDKPITTMTASGASHLALITDAAGQMSLVMTTTDTLLKRIQLAQVATGLDTVSLALLTPKNDGVFAFAGNMLAVADLDVAYPEANWRALFGKVWYEGHSEPKYIWQSSAGTEQSEPKLSLIPLIFGTLKATLYAMVFSIPLAILAAIYTSEFLPPRVRSRVKPIIELMASLPSVILGFIAALVLAPLLQANLCAVLLALFLLPATFVYAAHFWNLLPLEFAIRAQALRLLLLFACIPIGLGLSWLLAPLVEHWLFAGNIVQWMSGSIGGAVGGWMLMLIPTIVCAATMVVLGPLAEFNRRRAIASTPGQFALRGLFQLMFVTASVVAVSYGLSLALSGVGFDLRNSLLTSYQERNSLLVGAILGFCVIPLIYTLADDALQSVPQQLRSASLGCGATPWQTTVRVVVPSAMSGMFSAVMIGFGRAVGETMVVLMAAGNTPIMEWNPFNGFRTLSATLATELPEAAKGSTHFRTLFLAALLLFSLTLVANTVAEFVRIRFRRRGSQL